MWEGDAKESTNMEEESPDLSAPQQLHSIRTFRWETTCVLENTHSLSSGVVGYRGQVPQEAEEPLDCSPPAQ